MANTEENLIEARKKALKSPRIGKHGKNKKTIQKELVEKEARAYFITEVMKNFPEITIKEIQEAMKDFRVRHYVIDQVIGRAQDKVEHTIPNNLIGILEKAFNNEPKKPDKNTGDET